MGIYVGYLSPSIIKYLEPLTGDLLTARYADCIFNEEHFPTLGVKFKYHTECLEINWDALDTLKKDPHTIESELQVKRIIDLQVAANNLPDSFIVSKSVTKSYIPTKIVPERKQRRESSDKVNETQPQVERHFPHQQCTQFLIMGHWNAPTRSY